MFSQLTICGISVILVEDEKGLSCVPYDEELPM